MPHPAPTVPPGLGGWRGYRQGCLVPLPLLGFLPALGSGLVPSIAEDCPEPGPVLPCTASARCGPFPCL